MPSYLDGLRDSILQRHTRGTGGMIGRREQPRAGGGQGGSQGRPLTAQELQAAANNPALLPTGMGSLTLDWNEQQRALERQMMELLLPQAVKVQMQREELEAQAGRLGMQLQADWASGGRDMAFRGQESAYERALREGLQRREFGWRSGEAQLDRGQQTAMERMQDELLRGRMGLQQGYNLEQMGLEYGLRGDEAARQRGFQAGESGLDREQQIRMSGLGQRNRLEEMGLGQQYNIERMGISNQQNIGMQGLQDELQRGRMGLEQQYGLERDQVGHGYRLDQMQYGSQLGMQQWQAQNERQWWQQQFQVAQAEISQLSQLSGRFKDQPGRAISEQWRQMWANDSKLVEKLNDGEWSPEEVLRERTKNFQKFQQTFNPQIDLMDAKDVPGAIYEDGIYQKQKSVKPGESDSIIGFNPKFGQLPPDQQAAAMTQLRLNIPGEGVYLFNPRGGGAVDFQPYSTGQAAAEKLLPPDKAATLGMNYDADFYQMHNRPPTSWERKYDMAKYLQGYGQQVPTEFFQPTPEDLQQSLQQFGQSVVKKIGDIRSRPNEPEYERVNRQGLGTNITPIEAALRNHDPQFQVLPETEAISQAIELYRQMRQGQGQVPTGLQGPPAGSPAGRQMMPPQGPVPGPAPTGPQMMPPRPGFPPGLPPSQANVPTRPSGTPVGVFAGGMGVGRRTPVPQGPAAGPAPTGPQMMPAGPGPGLGRTPVGGLRPPGPPTGLSPSQAPAPRPTRSWQGPPGGAFPAVNFGGAGPPRPPPGLSPSPSSQPRDRQQELIDKYLPHPRSKADYDRLPSGALYVDRNGVTRRKK